MSPRLDQSLMVYLIKPADFSRYPPRGAVEFDPVVLTPRSYAMSSGYPETEDDVYTIYSPPQDREYENWEIETMRKVCELKGVRFQLHPPPITEAS